MYKTTFLFIYALMIIGRLLSILTFIQAPLITWIYVYLLDLCDYGAALRSGITFKQYEWIDKTIDFITRIYLAYTGYMIGGPYLILFLMVAFRFVGDIALVITKERKYLFIFPNLIEFFFPLYVIYMYHYSGNYAMLALFIALSTALKLFNEYLLHIKNWIDPFNYKYVKEHKEHERQIY